MTRGRQILACVALAGAACCATAAVASAENVIRTYAGTGATGSAGDGGPATMATLNQPAGLAIRPADSSLIIAESAGNVIRAIDLAGTITTLAGTGAGSTSGDGGVATAAGIFGPRDVEYAPAPNAGVLYIAETGGNRIRRVTAGGVISTVVGTGSASSGPDFGQASLTAINAPGGISVAPNGNLYIAETGGHKIRVVVAGSNGLIDATDPITTVAGTGTAGAGADGLQATSAAISSPSDVLALADGSFWISDSGNLRVRHVDPNGVIRFVSGANVNSGATLNGDGGPASLANVSAYGTIIGDGAGGVLLTETSRNRVRRIAANATPANGIVSTVAGAGVGCTLTDLCGDGGAGELAAMTYVTPTIPAPQIYGPNGAIIASGGRTYISDGNRIRVRIDVPGAGGPQGPAGPAGPQGVPGDAGPDGAAGASGSSGAAGSAGAAGATGPNGDDGDDGSDGPNGPAGRPGRAGSNGPSGQNGQNGIDGFSGGTGPLGATGADGPKGESGDPLAFIGGTPLVIALPASRIVRRHGRVILRIYVSTGSSIAGSAVKDGHVISRKRTFLRAGLKQLDLGRLEPGRYRIVVNAAASGGRSSTDRATLIVR